MPQTIHQKIARGWSLTRSSWHVLHQVKSLLLVSWCRFIVNAGLFITYAALGLGAYLKSTGPGSFYLGTHASWWAVLWLVPFYLLAVVANVLLSALSVHNILKHFSGSSVTLWASAKSAGRHVKLLTTLGLTNTVARLGFSFIPFAARWASHVVWGGALAFAVPVIMDKDDAISPLEVSKASASAIGRVWGETAAISASIWVIGFIVLVTAYIGSTLLAQIPYLLSGKNETVVIVTAVVGCIVTLTELFVFTQMALIANTALYVYTQHGQAPEPFDTLMLHATMTPHRARKLFSH